MKTHLASKLLLPLLLTVLLSSNSAFAAQVRDAVDGDRVTAQIALREPTRIKIEGDVITDLFGDVYDSKQNPNGRVVWESDKKKGEVILRLREESTRPVNLFVSTDKATYTLVLAPRDMPADTIVLRDRTPAPKLDTSSGLKAPSFHRLLKNMLVSMATNTIQPGTEIREIDKNQTLWTEAHLTLQRSFFASQIVGDHLVLTNRSGAEMVLSEQELDREDVLAISIENLRLRKGESTNVFVIRMRGENE